METPGAAMHLLYFLKDLTRFIQDLYGRAAEPFRTTITAIEDKAPRLRRSTL